MSIKRRRQLQLIVELLTSLLGVALFGSSLIFLLYSAVTPELSDRSFSTPLDNALGRGGAMIVTMIICALFTLGGLALAVRAIRRLRDPHYLEAQPPTWEDFM